MVVMFWCNSAGPGSEGGTEGFGAGFFYNHLQMPKLPRAMIRLNKQLDKLEMAQALEVSEDERHRALAMMLRGQDHLTGLPNAQIAACSLGNLCQRVGITHKQLITVYRDWKRSEAIIAAAQRLPRIVEGIAIDAEDRELICQICEGVGRIFVKGEDKPDIDKICIPCEGSGKVRQSGDPVARKQILEMMELAGRGIMNISAPGSNMIVSGGESLEETLRRARKPQSDAIEGKLQ